MIKRRVLAAIILLAVAIGSSFYWTGAISWTNIIVAMVGLILLHFRWRRQERGRLTPRQAGEVFE